MVNIMLYGFKTLHECKLVKDIKAAVKVMGIEDDTVITIMNARIEPCKEESDASPSKYIPFIRIYSPDEKEIRRIIDLFMKRGICADIQWQVLGGFISAENMKKGIYSAPKRAAPLWEGSE